MRVLGETTEHSVIAYSENIFIIDEYLQIEDVINYNPIAIVVESFRYETFKDVPTDIQKFLNKTINDIENKRDIAIAKLKIIEELIYPITPGSNIIKPNFDEIKDILIHGDTNKHFLLGTIKGTEETFPDIKPPYDNLYMMFDAKQNTLVSQKGIPFIMNHYKFREYPHIGLFGGSGSGKTFALRVLCEEMLKFRIPSVLLDPHYEMSFDEAMPGLNDEFKRDFKDAYEVFIVGEDIGIDFTELNSEEIVTLLKFLNTVSDTAFSIVEAVYEKGETFSRFINKIERLKNAFDFYDNPKNLHNKKDELDHDTVVTYERYKNKVPNATALRALLWRLNQLKDIGIFSGNTRKVEEAIINRKMAVIRGRDIHVKMLSEYMVKKLYRKRRFYKDWEERNRNTSASEEKPEKFPPFFFIADEAHNYAPDDKFMTTPLSMQLVQIAQEARKYGVFLVLATQRPASLNATLFAQLNTKFIFRLTAKNDITTIKMETNLSDAQSKRLPGMTSGNAFVSSPLLKETTYIRFRSTITTSPHSENPFDELESFDDGTTLKSSLLKFLPIQTDNIKSVHSKINKEVGKKISLNEIIETLEKMTKINMINKEDNLFYTKYYK